MNEERLSLMGIFADAWVDHGTIIEHSNKEISTGDIGVIGENYHVEVMQQL